MAVPQYNTHEYECIKKQTVILSKTTSLNVRQNASRDFKKKSKQNPPQIIIIIKK